MPVWLELKMQSSSSLYNTFRWKSWVYMCDLILGCCSVGKSCPTFCNHMNWSMPGFSVCHYLPEFAQIHVHWLSDAIQPFHPLLPSSPPALNLSQHQDLFPSIRVCSLHQVAEVLELQLQLSVLPMNIQDWFPLGLTGWISLQYKGLSRVCSNMTVQKHQFFGTLP